MKNVYRRTKKKKKTTESKILFNQSINYLNNRQKNKYFLKVTVESHHKEY